MRVLPTLLSDSYKQWHAPMYPDNLVKLYSNMTPRKSRLPGVNKAVFFGLQYYLKEYLIKQWNENFFWQPWFGIEKEYKRFHKCFSGADIDASNWKALHELGYMPLVIKALPEGTEVPIRVPFFTITNTHPEFAWLVNFLETQISTVIWDLITVATIARQYRKMFDKYALETTGSTDGVQWQGHDFSMRGRSSIESSFNQAGHLLSFTGTDTIPAVLFLEEYYNANMENELIGGSVPASEHSVMMCLGKEGEIETFKHLLSKFPTGILSVVSDTWNLWDVLTQYLPSMKDEIMARQGKIVIRPDSGNPVDIICGEMIGVEVDDFSGVIEGVVIPTGQGRTPEEKGVVELLWDIFGGTTNEKGYKVLDPHVGCIYGDAITLERAIEINERLKAKGFASINWVAGIGSYTYNYNTRDTLGMAIKATYCELEEEFWASPESLEPGVRTVGKEIFKDPITDSGEKKSAKGLLQVYRGEDGELKLKDQCTWAEEKAGLLTTVYKNGKLLVDQSLITIRQRLNANI